MVSFEESPIAAPFVDQVGNRYEMAPSNKLNGCLGHACQISYGVAEVIADSQLIALFDPDPESYVKLFAY